MRCCEVMDFFWVIHRVMVGWRHGWECMLYVELGVYIGDY
jgi:hypothetical protein